VQQPERAAREREREHEDERAKRVLASQLGAAGHSEREAAVGGGVGDGRERERHAVRDARDREYAQQEEE
jgi:hypothetical protein